ncbi:hypothetical protein PCANC_27710 [Puccinia coronata f. sp. avenae]|uniref:Uncharacterized protein n=1 Tax=Puccinia coronata f. sp. avenae TaxID=200324 RepID=A0A2N5TQ15_9BASI|nr:hypothetical protein PCANC_27710 [Puccinia coronata f. sp. avenae]
MHKTCRTHYMQALLAGNYPAKEVLHRQALVSHRSLEELIGKEWLLYLTKGWNPFMINPGRAAQMRGDCPRPYKVPNYPYKGTKVPLEGYFSSHKPLKSRGLCEPTGVQSLHACPKGVQALHALKTGVQALHALKTGVQALHAWLAGSHACTPYARLIEGVQMAFSVRGRVFSGCTQFVLGVQIGVRTPEGRCRTPCGTNFIFGKDLAGGNKLCY